LTKQPKAKRTKPAHSTQNAAQLRNGTVTRTPMSERIASITAIRKVIFFGAFNFMFFFI
jgi:hypothetical protein